MILAFLACLNLSAQGRGHSRMSFDEFQNSMKTYIAQKAGMSEKEADAFFPVYYELQEKLHELQNDAWKELDKGGKVTLKDGEYREILDAYYELNVSSARLEKSYEEKFLKIISATQLYKVLEAEKTFRRDMVMGMQPHRRGH